MGISYQIKAPHTSGHGRYGEIPHIPLSCPCMTVHNPISPHVFRRVHKIGTARRGRHGYCIFAAELRWRPQKCWDFLVLVEGSGVGGLGFSVLLHVFREVSTPGSGLLQTRLWSCNSVIRFPSTSGPHLSGPWQPQLDSAFSSPSSPLCPLCLCFLHMYSRSC